MENIFFNSGYSNFEQTIINLLVFIALSGAILYVTYFVLSKLLFKKSKQRKEISLRLTFLWSLFVFFILFNTYIFIFIYRIGIDNMNFTSGLLYLGIFSQIFIYLALIIFFFIKRHTLKKIINVNSLN
jgi:drug/metabolite transporter (DMT)-like permease